MTIQSETKQKPALTLRDGTVSIAIWANTTKEGVFYKAQPLRSYKTKDDQWKETDSFSQTDLLKLSRLIENAYGEIAALRERDKLEK